MKKKTLFDKESMILPKLPAYFLFACMLWVAWQLFQVVRPFMMVMMFSGVVATITYPVYARLELKLKDRKRLASVITCFLVMLLIVIPIGLFLLVLTGQAVDLYKLVSNYLQHLDFNSLLSWKPGNFFYDFSGQYRDEIEALVKSNFEALKSGLTASAQSISAYAAKQSAVIFTQIVLTIFNLLLMFFTLYFFYKDGQSILKKLMIISPIPVKHEQALFKKFTEISKATIFGTFLTAVAQGLVAWIGFSIAGVPSAFFWATSVAICSLIPTIGTGLVWLPMGLLMLASGNWWGAFIIIWGLGLIGTVDNVLRVVFIGSTANLNPLLTFISVFGGILYFDLIGVILGPMLLVLFMTFLHIYELEYADYLGVEKAKTED